VVFAVNGINRDLEFTNPMATAVKKIRETRVKNLLKKAGSKSKKNPSAFFGKLKDGIDGLAYQKDLRNEWK
jgi:hypothetical protein